MKRLSSLLSVILVLAWLVIPTPAHSSQSFGGPSPFKTPPTCEIGGGVNRTYEMVYEAPRLFLSAEAKRYIMQSGGECTVHFASPTQFVVTAVAIMALDGNGFPFRVHNVRVVGEELNVLWLGPSNENNIELIVQQTNVDIARLPVAPEVPRCHGDFTYKMREYVAWLYENVGGKDTGVWVYDSSYLGDPQSSLHTPVIWRYQPHPGMTATLRGSAQGELYAPIEVRPHEPVSVSYSAIWLCSPHYAIRGESGASKQVGGLQENWRVTSISRGANRWTFLSAHMEVLQAKDTGELTVFFYEGLKSGGRTQTSRIVPNGRKILTDSATYLEVVPQPGYNPNPPAQSTPTATATPMPPFFFGAQP